MHTLDLTIADISKIEGKASCDIKVREGNVEEVKFTIAEYKRFYTQAIRGKDVVALPQLTARICGTCSNAHLLCAIKAVENALKLQPTLQTILLRKLLNFGLIIRDHGLHLYVFVLPDIFGKDSILDFDVQNSLEHKYLDDTFAVKAAGNNLSIVVGGRSVHAPFATVGGFTRLPLHEELQKSLAELQATRPRILDLIKLFFEKDTTLIIDDLDFAAVVDSEYSFLYGNLIRSDGESVDSEKYGEYLEHVVIPYSHASGYRFDGNVYMVGALARLNLAKQYLHPKTKESTKKYLEVFPSKNIFHNNLAQAIEILHAVDSSIDILKNLRVLPEKPLPIKRQEGTGIGVIEAPRGALYYKLEVDASGKIKTGRIVVPTGQNQISIEGSIRKFLEKNIANIDSKEKIEYEVERIVRAYDPCMSCASHFLKIHWK
ncbi:nickel-dependent hydrogenase large subunit [Candidatus Gottesmanbacteria bacterium]|nr:nickel-dependent hydrogenase large subunit [Candidatus Gottesmanbacteria bacterium]